MTSPKMPLIAQYLAERPFGATGYEIAAFLETSIDSALESLMRMMSRGQIERIGGATKANATWRLGAQEKTPPVFRAMETLEAMREVARNAYGHTSRMP